MTPHHPCSRVLVISSARQYRDQWTRKIAKDLLAIYGNKDPAAPKTPTKASSAAKAPASPTKRKRMENQETKGTKEGQH